MPISPNRELKVSYTARMGIGGRVFHLPLKFWDIVLSHVPSGLHPVEWYEQIVMLGYNEPTWKMDKVNIPRRMGETDKQIVLGPHIKKMMYDAKTRSGRPAVQAAQFLYWTGLTRYATDKLMELSKSHPVIKTPPTQPPQSIKKRKYTKRKSIKSIKDKEAPLEPD